MFALLCIIWGSTWLVIKTGYGGLGPFNVAAWRFLIAGALLVVIGVVFRIPWPQDRVEWGLAAFVGLFLFAFDYGLIYWAELELESGLTAVLFATMPLMTAFLAHAYLPGERITPRKLGGTALAFVGVAALFVDKLRVDPEHMWPMLAMIGSAISAAVASVATKRHGYRLHPVAMNAPAMLIGGVVLTFASFAAGDGFSLPSAMRTWLAILYLAVVGSIITFLIYFQLLKTWDATTMSFVAVFTPIVAVILGYVVLDEKFGTWTALGVILVLAGVTLSITGGRRGATAGEGAVPAERA